MEMSEFLTHIDSQLTQLRGYILVARPFATLGGGVIVGCYLTQCWLWMREKEDPHGWICKNDEDFCTLGIKVPQQIYARSKLKRLGILEIKRAPKSPFIYYRINVEHLDYLLNSLIDKEG